MTHTHFWLKRNEIEKQCEEWISDMEGQVESDPNGSRAVSVGLASLKVIRVSFPRSKLYCPSIYLNVTKMNGFGIQ